MSEMKYFIFSKTQFNERTSVESKLGKRFYPGSVVVRGKSKEYTQLVDNLDTIRYSDYKVIAQTDNLKSIKYTKPYSSNK